MRSRHLAALTGLLVFALVVPASANHGGIHPTFRTEQNYFHCAGDTKVQNVSATQGQVPSWNTTPPAGSVQAGHGCGYYDPLVNNASAAGSTAHLDPVWQGTFSGNLRDLTIEVHRLGPTAGATFPNRFVLNVQVDGEVRYAANVDLTPTVSSTQASHSFKLTLQGLGYATEDGDGTAKRTVRIQLQSFNETQSLWVFDTTEVPAGVTFNPAAPQGAIYQAN